MNRSYIKSEEEQPQFKVFQQGREFIEKNHTDDNWFLQIESFDPHEPFYVMEKYRKLYEAEYHGKHYDWPRGKADDSEEAIEHIRNQYKALVTMCDYNLGKVLDLMDQYDMWKNTMLIVVTDHGFLLGEHQYWGKNTMPYYNEVAHTPLFIYDPRHSIQGQRKKSLVQIIDWAPTLLEYFGQSIRPDMLGESLSSTIRDDTPIRDSCVFGVFSGHVNVTDGRYVYMRAAHPGMENNVFNYTLTPQHMTSRFKVEELQKAKWVPGFSFTKGPSLMKIPSKDRYKVSTFGDLLFDREQDPLQLHPIHNKKLEDKMMNLLRRNLKEVDAPSEQYERLGL